MSTGNCDRITVAAVSGHGGVRGIQHELHAMRGPQMARINRQRGQRESPRPKRRLPFQPRLANALAQQVRVSV